MTASHSKGMRSGTMAAAGTTEAVDVACSAAAPSSIAQPAGTFEIAANQPKPLPLAHVPWTAESLAALTASELCAAHVGVGGKSTPVTTATRKVVERSVLRKQSPTYVPLPPPLPPPRPPSPPKQQRSTWKQERYPFPPPNPRPLTTFTEASVVTPPQDPNTSWNMLKAKLRATAEAPNCAEAPCPPGHTRWVCISDTHGE